MFRVGGPKRLAFAGLEPSYELPNTNYIPCRSDFHAERVVDPQRLGLVILPVGRKSLARGACRKAPCWMGG